MAVGDGQVEPAVVVGVEERDPEAEHGTRVGASRPIARRLVAEQPSADVVVDRSSTRRRNWSRPGRAGRRRRGRRRRSPCRPDTPPPALQASPASAAVSSNCIAAQVVKQEVGGRVVGDEQVDLAVVVEVGRDHAQAPAVGVDDPRLVGHVVRTGRRRCGRGGRASAGNLRGSQYSYAPGRLRWAAQLGMVGVPLQVVADVEVEIAVAVEVGQGRRGRPVAVAPRPASSVASSNVPSPRLR